jgi:predicted RNase H-like HicB family nuclease
MADLRYPIVISAASDDDGGGFVAFAPDLEGCIADGDTPEAALADLQSAILEWIDEAKRLGREVPVPGVNGYFKKPEFREIPTI